jgi:hypothetical protein
VSRDKFPAWRKGDGPIVARHAFHSGAKHFNKPEIEALGYTQLKLPGERRFVRSRSPRAKKAAGKPPM